MATLSILRWKDYFALSCGPSVVTKVSYKREAGVSERGVTMEASWEGYEAMSKGMQAA